MENTANDYKLFNELIEAISNNDKETVLKLIKKGVVLNRELFIEGAAYTPLILSIKKGNNEITRLLLDNGAKIDLPVVRDSFYRKTALNVAVSKKNYEITEELIKRGAKLNVTADHYTPLMTAICNENVEIAKLLILNGANYDFYKRDNKDIEKDTLDRLHNAINNMTENGKIKYIDNAIKTMDEKKQLNMQQLKDTYINEIKNDKNNTFKDESIKLYTELKMGLNIDIPKYPQIINELLSIIHTKNTQIKQKQKLNNINEEITSQCIHDLEDKTPIYIRGLSAAIGLEQQHQGTIDSSIKKHNETGIDLEIRKLARIYGEETLKNLKGEKTGNKFRCVSMCNFGTTNAFRPIGYGIIKGNIKDIKEKSLDENIKENIKDIYAAQNTDLNTKYSELEDTLVSYDNSLYCDASATDKMLNNLFQELKNSDESKYHNEVVMDISDDDVKFIYWSETKDESTYYLKLSSVYFKKKFFEITGRELPIFQYRASQKDYLLESNFSNEEIKNMLKIELLDTNHTKLKHKYNNLNSLHLFMAFNDEMSVIDDFTKNNIMEHFVEDMVQDVLNINKKFSAYDIINLINYAGMIKGEKYKQECITKIFTNLNLQAITIVAMQNMKSSFWSMKTKSSKDDIYYVKSLLEIMSEIKALAKGETIDFLESKINECIDKTLLHL